MRWLTGWSWPLRSSSATSERSTTVRKTAYLDGLRGFCAFLVYVLHHEMWAHSATDTASVIENPWGYKGNYYFVCLPLLRVFFSGGHAAVATFYIISGYVLSHKPLSLIISGDFLGFGDNICSAIFRRWFRLYIPMIITTFGYFTFLRITGIEGPDISNKPTYLEQLQDWFVEFKKFSYIWRGNDGGLPWLTYNRHTWSIPLELKGSLVVYLTVMATSRFTRYNRWRIYAGLLIYFIWLVDGWYCAYFVSGMWLADIDLHADIDDLPDFLKKLQSYRNYFFYPLFIISLYLAGVPASSFDMEVFENSPGWLWLSYFRPGVVLDPKWFYLFWSSTALVASVSHINWLKSFFETRFCQFLGRISYMLYLFHGPVLFILGGPIYAAVGYVREGADDKNYPWWCNRFQLPNWGPVGLEFNFLAPQIIFLPLTFWLSYVATKLIDDRSVRWAQKLYKAMLDTPVAVDSSSRLRKGAIG